MYHDVANLRDFYYRSALGRSVQKRLQLACRAIWPSIEKEIVAGYGFASPILRPFMEEASHIVNLMPASQGVMAWPPHDPNLSVLCNESAWPLGAASIDRIIMLHGIEHAGNADALMNEAWRVLEPEGKMMMIFANRLGIWSTNESTPFGQGRPFGINQLESFLRVHQFEITKRQGALYGSPWKSALGLRVSNSMEWLGERSRGKFLAGVWVIELQKSQPPKPIMIPKREPIFATPELKPAGVMNRHKERQKYTLCDGITSHFIRAEKVQETLDSPKSNC